VTPVGSPKPVVEPQKDVNLEGKGYNISLRNKMSSRVRLTAILKNKMGKKRNACRI
jgi:hypothetical protein